MNYSFEKLEVWQKSRVLVKEIYILSRKFPADEKFGLTSQVRRAAVSVNSNIAEGCTRWSNKEKARFYEIAYGSLIEVLSQLILASDLEFITEQELATTRSKLEEVSRMLNSLRKSTK